MTTNLAHKKRPPKGFCFPIRTGLRRKVYLHPTNGNLYHYAANNPVRYIDPDGNSLFSFFVQTNENYREYNDKYRTTQRTTILTTFRLYSGDKNTLQDFKDRNNFNEGEIYEHDSNEMPDALSDYSDLLENENLILVTAETNSTTKYDKGYGEYKTSEKEKLILIYEKRGDEYVKISEIQSTSN